MRSVHPRVCGEQALLRRSVQDLGGSSPRVRGTAETRFHKTRHTRFIPACAGNRTPRPPTTPPAPVHPRVCGEQPLIVVRRSGRFGSSPRVRGTDSPASIAASKLRFIPACAGNRITAGGSGGSGSVHPRVCGEQDVVNHETWAGTGSSPRVRGTDIHIRRGHPGRRFIPACAGNRITGVPGESAGAVHPRVCGEQSVPRAVSPVSCGSSPRVRGTAAPPRAIGLRPRFIPACAGNSTHRPQASERRAVHPRVCGEQTTSASLARSDFGSSPRVRGTAATRRCSTYSCRFIPACAGNSTTSSYFAVSQPVHPRVCGEQPIATRARPPSVGSSPRVRGTERVADGSFRADRFIPACAGNSSRAPGLSSENPVHPRVCGEQADPRLGRRKKIGSSPRVRGTACALRDLPGGGRFIPACAGNRVRAWLMSAPTPVHPQGNRLNKPLTRLYFLNRGVRAHLFFRRFRMSCTIAVGNWLTPVPPHRSPHAR